MIGRHLQAIVVVMLAAIWGGGIYYWHDRGHLRFLDRFESTTIDLRTLVRGARAPPDLVTIVAIDDAVVKQKGVYPLSRIDLARIVDEIARLQPKVIALDLLLVDKGPDDADDVLAKSLAAHPAIIGAAAVFPEATQSLIAGNDQDP